MLHRPSNTHTSALSSNRYPKPAFYCKKSCNSNVIIFFVSHTTIHIFTFILHHNIFEYNCRNFKIGGAPRLVNIPINGLMTIGYYECPDAKNKRKSFGAIVSTMDINRSADYFSPVSAHTSDEELRDQLVINLTKAVTAYHDHHGELPERICFYREVVDVGKVQYFAEHELKALKSKLEEISAERTQRNCFNHSS